MAELPIERIISSPFVRARQSIAPLAERLGLPITTDERLAERVLAARDLPNWLTALKASFDDIDRCFAGGESSRAAMQRASEVVCEAMAHVSTTLLVTHGNLMALVLKLFDDRIGFAEWQQLTTPDVYRITRGTGRVNIVRNWQD